MKTMSSEVRNEVIKLWNENRNKQLSLDKVIRTTCDYLKTALKKDGVISADALLYLSVLGDEKKNHKQRGAFRKQVLHQMPYMKENGSKDEIVVDWQEVDIEKAKESKIAMNELRVFVGEQEIKLKTCVGYATVKRELPKMQEFTIKYESGYTEKIRKQAKDKDGNAIIEERIAYYVPRKKTVWGYTDDVRDAIIKALEVMCE